MTDEIDEDREILERLERDGHHMSRPMPFEFFAVAGSREAAEAIAQAIDASDLPGEVEIAEDDGGDEELDGVAAEVSDVVLWEVRLTVEMVADIEAIRRIESTVSEIALDHDASGDGWGTPGNVEIAIDES